jgi:transglutaminase-like putative cysteine protease
VFGWFLPDDVEITFTPTMPESLQVFLASRPSLPSAATQEQSNEQMAGTAPRWLRDTPLLNISHPKLRLTAKKLTDRMGSPAAKAAAIHRSLRGMPFGAVADSVGTTSIQVLKNGRGDCHCKSTLFVAMLRSLDIPARMRFVTLKPDFLHGVIDLADTPVEHAVVEVWLNDAWVSTDSHVVDAGLATAAKLKLKLEKRSLGYGMHVRGQVNWDGSADSHAQFLPDDPDSAPLHDWGVFDDPYQFYHQTPYLAERLSMSSRLKWIVAASLVNRRVNAIRKGG